MNFKKEYIDKHNALANNIKDAINMLFQHLVQTFREPTKQDWLTSTKRQVELLLDSSELTKEALVEKLNQITTNAFNDAAFDESMALCKLLCVKYFYVQQMLDLLNQKSLASVTEFSLQTLSAKIKELGTGIDEAAFKREFTTLGTKNAEIELIFDRIGRAIQNFLNATVLQEYEKAHAECQATLAALDEQTSTFATTIKDKEKTLSDYQDQFETYSSQKNLSALETLSTTLLGDSQNFTLHTTHLSANIQTLIKKLPPLNEKLNKTVTNVFALNDEDVKTINEYERLRDQLKERIEKAKKRLAECGETLTSYRLESPGYQFKERLTHAYRALIDDSKETPLTLCITPGEPLIEDGFIASMSNRAKQVKETVTSYVTNASEIKQQAPDIAADLQNLLTEINEKTVVLYSSVFSEPTKWFSETVDVPSPTPEEAWISSTASIKTSNSQLNMLLKQLEEQASASEKLDNAQRTHNPARQLQIDLGFLLSESNRCSTEHQDQARKMQKMSEKFEALKKTVEADIKNFEVIDPTLNGRVDNEIIMVENIQRQLKSNPQQNTRLLTLDSEYKPDSLLKALNQLKQDNQKRSGKSKTQLNKTLTQLTERVLNLSTYITDPKNDFIIDSKGMLSSKGKHERKIKILGLLIGCAIGAVIILAAALTFATGGLGLTALIPLIFLGAAFAPLGWFVGSRLPKVHAKLQNIKSVTTTPSEMPLDGRRSPHKMSELREFSSSPAPQTGSEAVQGNNDFPSSPDTSLAEEAQAENTFESNVKSPRFGRTG